MSVSFKGCVQRPALRRELSGDAYSTECPAVKQSAIPLFLRLESCIAQTGNMTETRLHVIAKISTGFNAASDGKYGINADVAV